MQPLVSIIIPLHNKEAFIRETLSSLVVLSWESWEAIVVENHSSDRSPDLVRDFIKDDSRFRLIEAPDSVRGPGAARNFGLGHASGEWVLFLDADDLLDSNHLKGQLGEVESATHVVGGGWTEFDDANPDEKRYFEPFGGNDDMARLKASSIAAPPWCLHAGIIRRDWLVGSRLWSPELDKYISEDTAFWFRALHGANIQVRKTYGALYRKGISESRNKDSQMATWLAGMREVVNSNLAWLRERGETPSTLHYEYLTRLFIDIYVRSRKHGCKEAAQKALQEANRYLSKAAACGEITLSLKLRKWLGISTFEFFARLRR